ncbi:molybdate ABC transporter substrate-binding protein [Psychrobacter lutiphocae]|uniref:molybdate ABC transporter substrate-binding protein n=1 Tax=Psychrobacter lutiphocae TaxID=540500 RepID=UPI00038171B2|nr:molybdate ABC transporter substrate-binding protein [Psychrobacter lutiphocae]
MRTPLTHKIQQPSTASAACFTSLKSLALLPLAVLVASCSNPASDAQSNTQDDTQDSVQSQADDAEVLRIAAAANLAGVLPAIIDAYQQDTSQQNLSQPDSEQSEQHASTSDNRSDNLPADTARIEVTYASSGKLYAQINSGAPYDVFLSADQQFPAKYIEAHPTADPQRQPFTYARGQLALYSSNHDLSPISALTKASLETLWLTDSKPRMKVSIANPELAPYGASAKAFLQQHRLYDSLQQQKMLIQAENIGQAFQYTHTATTDYGFVALSQLLSAKVAPSKYQVLAPDSYPPILQDGIVVSEHPQAVSFAHYLQSDAAQQLFQQAGYL